MTIGDRTIAGLPTSTAAFVGQFSRGPLETPIDCSSLADLDRDFGGSSGNDRTGDAIRQFFANGGRRALVVRVAGADDVVAPAPAEVTLQCSEGHAVLRAFAGRRVQGESLADPGSWGNSIRLEVDHATADSSLFNLVVSEVLVGAGGQVVLRSETFENVSIDPANAADGVEAVNEGSRLVQIEPVDPPCSHRPAQTGTSGAPVQAGVTLDSTAVLAVDAGKGPVSVNLADLDRAGVSFADDPEAIRSALERAIRAAGREMAVPDPLLTEASVTLQSETTGAQRLRVTAGGEDQADFDPEAVLVIADTVGITAAALGLVSPAAVENVQRYSLGAGTRGRQQGAVAGNDGLIPDAATLMGDTDRQTGMYALRKADPFNILCIPAAAGDHLSNEDSAAVYAAAESFCEAERAFLILDVPDLIDDSGELQDWVERSGLRHRNAAIYFPRLMIRDQAGGNLRTVGPSGTMAGVYARIDESRGVWKAPAGLEATLWEVEGLERELTESEGGEINRAGINALRRFSIPGLVAWGARTLEGVDALGSEWKYVPVRRLALFLEASIARGTRWVVFESNDEQTWSQVRIKVAEFMHLQFTRGAFRGSTSREAYFVKCDGESTTQSDVQNGVLNILVGFAPLKPAEFVIIRIQQMTRRVCP